MRKRRSYGGHGLPYWLAMRVRRMLVTGRTPFRIARDTGVSEDVIRGLRDRMPDLGFRRCPICGGMVQPPCVACHLRMTRYLESPRPARAR